ncbi:transposon, En/Spm-like protein [Tanacetum coccineum]
MCLKNENVKLSLVIPGKKNPGQNIDVFLQPLIKELKMLWNSGVETYDAYCKNNFHLKAALLWTVSDFPAYAMLSGWSTHGKLACPHCMGDVDSFQLQNGGKPSGPPPQLTGDEIWEQIRYLPTIYEGKPYRPGNKKIDGFGVTHNWVKRSIFWELPYWHTLLIRHNLDLMHIEKNFFENLFHTIMGTLKTKDNVKARKDIEIYCDRPELHIFKVRNKDMKPKASYTLSKPQLQNVCEWMTKIKFPDGKPGSLKRTVRNKARVEGSIVESYLVNELSMHCSLYFDPRIETRLNREPRNFAPDIYCSSRADSRLNIFKVPSHRLFNMGTKRLLTTAEKHKAHTYIFLNCEDVHCNTPIFTYSSGS